MAYGGKNEHGLHIGELMASGSGRKGRDRGMKGVGVLLHGGGMSVEFGGGVVVDGRVRMWGTFQSLGGVGSFLEAGPPIRQTPVVSPLSRQDSRFMIGSQIGQNRSTSERIQGEKAGQDKKVPSF
eukprot:768356-Hanusia_phi.AAC.4